MWGLPHDAADMDRARFLRMKAIRDVVLQHFARAPARDVEKSIVQGEVDVGDQRRHRLESLSQRRESFGIGRLGRNFNDLLNLPRTILPVPEPD